MEAPAAPPARRSTPAGLPAPSGRLLVLVAGVIVLGVLFWLGREVLAPFVVGSLVVYLLDPLVERLARVRVAGRHVPRALLILVVYVLVAVLIVEFVLLLVGPLVEQVQAFVRAAPGYVDDLNARLADVFAWWNRLNLPADVRQQVGAAIQGLLANVGSLVPTILRPVVGSVVGLVGSVFGYLIIPVWAFWILRDRPRLVRAFDRAVPAAWRADTWAALGIIRRVFGSWIRGQVVLGLVVGLATFLGLLVLGALVDPVFRTYAVLLAVIAGILELLPVIGPIIAAVPAVLLGATAGVPGIVAALILYFAIQQVENTILVPKIQGDATDLHPAAVIVALLLGGAIAGLLGAILALPVTATLRDLYVYAFRRAGGMTPAEAATGDARADPDTGPAGLEAEAPADGADAHAADVDAGAPGASPPERGDPRSDGDRPPGAPAPGTPAGT